MLKAPTGWILNLLKIMLEIMVQISQELKISEKEKGLTENDLKGIGSECESRVSKEEVVNKKSSHHQAQGFSGLKRRK